MSYHYIVIFTFTCLCCNMGEDRPEGATKESKAINFKWTPELVKIGTSRGAMHPSLGPIEEHNGFRIFKYRPGMTLPDPADTRECLRWAGLSDKKIIEVEQKFNQLYPDYQGPSCGYAEKYHRTGYTEIIFPKVEKMLDMFIQGMHDDHDEVEKTHSECLLVRAIGGSQLINSI
jgi:hypothetical protein